MAYWSKVQLKAIVAVFTRSPTDQFINAVNLDANASQTSCDTEVSASKLWSRHISISPQWILSLEGLLTELRYLYDFAYDTPRVLQISGRGIVGSLISFKAMFISSAVFWEDRYSSTCSPGIYSPLQAQGTRSNSSALLKYLRVWYSEERLIMDNY